MISVKIIERKKPHNGSRLDLHVGSDFSQTISSNKTLSKATCIWKFVQRQLPHSGFGLQYRRVLFGYQARTFHFSFFNVSHKSLSFITWCFIEYLHTQDFQRATAHLNAWTNFFFFFASCLGVKNTKNILTETKRRKIVFTLRSPPHSKPFLLT